MSPKNHCERAKDKLGPSGYVRTATSPSPTMLLARVEALEAALVTVAAHAGISSATRAIRVHMATEGRDE